MDYELAKGVDSTVPKERWIASLSNGETIHENNIKGAPPAWERLKCYVEDNGLSITSLRLLILGQEIKMPSGQQGYIQKKVAWTNSYQGGVRKCVGYVQDGLSLIVQASSDGDSFTRRDVDPGEPWTIYSKEIREAMLK